MSFSWRNVGGGVAIIVALALVFVAIHYSSAFLKHSVSSAPITAAVSLRPTTTTAAISNSHVASSSSVATSTSKAATSSPLVIAPISSTTQASLNLSASGTHLLKSSVNIVCLSSNKAIPSISASGEIIDPRGIILTAAHVAQLFLLEEYLGPSEVQCLIRTGSPARRAYIAEPIFVSPSWVKANPSTLTTKTPIGTGQNDVALLAITDTATSTPLPSTFPYMPLATTNPVEGQQVAVTSYGAQYLSGSDINYSLYPILVFGTIAERFTFDTNTIDMISIKGTAASQEGSSGGGVSNTAGQLIGTITTSSIQGSIADRTLNAVTVSHLRSTYLQDTGHSLDTTLANNSLSSLVSGFSGEAQTLGGMLAQAVGVSK